MSNEKFYLCNGKVCFTSFKCKKGILLTGCPGSHYSSKEDYINGTDNCITIARVAETGEELYFEGKLKAVDVCPMEDEKDKYEWAVLIEDENFQSLLKKEK